MNSMNYIGKFISNFRDFYNEINAATLTGAIDVVVVQQPDGSFTCSPFHVRFGKLGVLRSREKIVDIEINGEPLDIHMKLGESGEAFFVEEVGPNEEGEEEAIPPHLACSPIPSEDHYEPWLKDEAEKWGAKNDDEDEDGPMAKVFVAETISAQDDDVNREKVRKISIAAGEFKTIEAEEKDETDQSKETEAVSREDKLSAEGKLSSNSSSNSLSQMSITGDKTGGGSSTGGGKRKRRRRSLLKKKNNNNAKEGKEGKEGSNGEASKTEEEMFPIDDVTGVPAPHEGEAAVEELNSLEADDSLDQLSIMANPSTVTDYHFFSDTELTPGCSPESRSFSPVASDSELEQRQRPGTVSVDSPVAAQSWNWGELPSPPTMSRSQPSASSTELATEAREETEPKTEKQKQEEAQKSMLSGMFSFMKKTKHLRHGQATEGGIYLSELNPQDMDPEVAALYFSHSYRGEALARKEGFQDEPDLHREEDAESGNGPSIPQSPCSQSPTTVEGAKVQRMLTSVNEQCLDRPVDVAISLCGHLDSGLTEELFNMNMVSYDDFVHNPMMIENPDLVVRMHGKYYNWTTACPLVMCLSVFSKPLPLPVVDMLSHELNKAEPSQRTSKDKKPMESTRGYSSWFNWRRSSDPKSKEGKAEPVIIVTPLTPPTPTTPTAPKDEATVLSLSPLMEEPAPQQPETELTQRLEQVVVDEEKEEGYAGSNSSEESDGGGHKGGTKIPVERRFYQQTLSDKFRKTLRLSSQQIAGLNLQDGANEVVFSVTTAYQGTSRCKCHVYKWNYDDRIVISDIDGTITKSDVLGHILPIVGKDWAQSGVAQLFTKIKDNGYKLLYLSARAIGQARVTRDYLKSIKQGDLSLPDGPLLLNPTSLISAFHREVIEKKPEEFKISCLRDISALFPTDVRPFYAGYGNRVNDVWAYRAVGIPIMRIFTINYKGELKHELTQTFQSSYTKMCQLVDEMFPPPAEDVPHDFSNFVYWRDPIPELHLETVSATDNNASAKKI